MRCPFCKSATLEVVYTGPLTLEAARAQRREDERVEAQRIHAEHEQAEHTPQPQPQPQPQRHGTPEAEEPEEVKEEENEEAMVMKMLGDGYSSVTDEALLVAWLRRLGIADEDAGVDTVLAAGGGLADRLEALCALHELASTEDVQRACACCTDPAAAGDIDPAAYVCAQLINVLV